MAPFQGRNLGSTHHDDVSLDGSISTFRSKKPKETANSTVGSLSGHRAVNSFLSAPSTDGNSGNKNVHTLMLLDAQDLLIVLFIYPQVY